MDQIISILSNDSRTSLEWETLKEFLASYIEDYYGIQTTLDSIVQYLQIKKVIEHQSISLGPGLYIILEGIYEIQKKYTKVHNLVVVKQGFVKFNALTNIVMAVMLEQFEQIHESLLKIKLDANVQFLQKYFFHNFAKFTIVKLARMFSQVKYPYNHKLYKQGDVAHTVYLIKSGELKIFHEGKEVKIIGQGTLFGEHEVFTKKDRINTVVTITPLIVLQISNQSFQLMLQDFPNFRQYLQIRSMVKQSNRVKSKSKDRCHTKPIIENDMLKIQRKLLLKISPQQKVEDYEEIFKMSKQIEMDRIRTGIILPVNQRAPMICRPKTRPQTGRQTSRDQILHSSKPSESILRSLTPQNLIPQKILSSRHNQFRASPKNERNLKYFVSGLKTANTSRSYLQKMIY